MCDNNESLCVGTVKPASHFNPAADVAALKKAMMGLGTDEKTIIDVLCHRSLSQRLEIAKVYRQDLGKDLVTELKCELSGNFRCLIKALMTPLHLLYAKELHKAIAGLGTDEDALIEILCTLSSANIRKVAVHYERLYKNSLEADIKGDTIFLFRFFCVTLCKGLRDDTAAVDEAAARDDAKDLVKADKGKWGATESKFLNILATRSYQQLRRIFIEYKALTDKDIEEKIREEFSGDFLKGILSLVRSVRSKTSYFAERLHEAMKGMGTDDKTLIRIIVTRCEIDLGDIKNAFLDKYGKSLEDWIVADTSGDYKAALLEIIR